MFEKEQELLKKVYDRKNVLVGDKTVEKKNKVQIAYSQIFLRLLHLLLRYISS